MDNSALYQSVNSGLTDITSNWARGHINYCYTTGIIAGRGNGTFDPSATVTALEAAKMLLVAVGYDPKIASFLKYLGEGTCIELKDVNQDNLSQALKKAVESLPRREELQKKAQRLKDVERENIRAVARLLDVE